MFQKSIPCLLLMLIFCQTHGIHINFPARFCLQQECRNRSRYATTEAHKCITPTNKLGTCIPFTECVNIQNKLTFKETMNYINTAHCGSPSERLFEKKICCQLEEDPLAGYQEHFESNSVTSTNPASATFLPYVHPSTYPASIVFPYGVYPDTNPGPIPLPDHVRPNTSPTPATFLPYVHPSTYPPIVFPYDVYPDTNPGPIPLPDHLRPNTSPTSEYFPNYGHPNISQVLIDLLKNLRLNTNPAPEDFPDYVHPNISHVLMELWNNLRLNTSPAPEDFPDYVHPTAKPDPIDFPYDVHPDTNPAPIPLPDYERPDTSPASEDFPDYGHPNAGQVTIDVWNKLPLNTSPAPEIFTEHVRPNKSRTPINFPHYVRPNTSPMPIVTLDDVLPNDDCGQQPMYSTPFNILRGIGEFPWLALLVHKTYNGIESPGCSGFLIHAKFVLTAAHCLQENRFGTLDHIILGMHNNTHEIMCLDQFCNDKSNPKIVAAYRPIIHERYDDNLLTDNIALIPLKEQISFTGFISPICLAKTEDSSKFLISTGWDKTEFDTGSLKKLKNFVSRFDLKDCIEEINIHNSDKGFVTETNMCAIGTCSCTRDSGGPLMSFNVNQRWYAEGIVNYDIGCAKPNWPSVYTSIPSFYDWIVTNMQKQLYAM